MAINNVGNTGHKPQLESQKLNQQQAQAAGEQKAQAQAAASAPKQDSVSLTQSAQQISQVQKKGSDAPVNSEKVEKLKKAIQNGEYKVNPEVLASKIAKSEAEIFGLAKG